MTDVRFVCNGCAHRHKFKPKAPADSGVESRLCAVCGHFNIGSYEECTLGKWCAITPIRSTKIAGPPVREMSCDI